MHSDAQERTSFPKNLFAYFQVFHNTMGDTFQIWKPESFEASESAVDDLLDAMPSGVDIWTLLEDGEEG